MATTRFCKWPPNAELAAVAYEAECTEQFVLMAPSETQWGYVREDKNGNWTVPMLGPPFEWGLPPEPVGEPASCALLRAGAVVVETPEWPIEE